MRTQNEIEVAICNGVRGFAQDRLGIGPKDIRTHVIGDLIVVRLTEVLTPVEKQMAKSSPSKKGRELIKQSRSLLIESASPTMKLIVENACGVKTVSLHHDISTNTGEEIILFSLEKRPVCQASKR